jgi:hypothetical protein
MLAYQPLKLKKLGDFVLQVAPQFRTAQGGRADIWRSRKVGCCVMQIGHVNTAAINPGCAEHSGFHAQFIDSFVTVSARQRGALFPLQRFIGANHGQFIIFDHAD